MECPSSRQLRSGQCTLDKRSNRPIHRQRHGANRGEKHRKSNDGTQRQKSAGRGAGQIRPRGGSCFCAAKARRSPSPTPQRRSPGQRTFPRCSKHGIMVEAGGHGLLTFRRQDLIVVSPASRSTRRSSCRSKASACPSSANSSWPAASSKANHRHHRLQRQDHHHHAGRRDLRRSRSSHAGRRQHRRAGHRTHRREHARDTWSCSKSPASSSKRPSSSIPASPSSSTSRPTISTATAPSKTTRCQGAIFAAQTPTTSSCSTPKRPHASRGRAASMRKVYWFSGTPVAGRLGRGRQIVFRPKESAG
jgi:hypothetical protein